MKAATRPIATIANLPVYWSRSRRASIGLFFHAPDWLEVRTPLRLTRTQTLQFVQNKAEWIARAVVRERAAIWIARDRLASDALHAFRTQVETLAQLFANRLETPPPVFRIVLRSQRTRWGSCSSQGTISINCACARLPATLLAYVVAHEVCHLRHMDHSPAFYQTLQALMPDAMERKKELSRYRIQGAKPPADPS